MPQRGKQKRKFNISHNNHQQNSKKDDVTVVTRSRSTSSDIDLVDMQSFANNSNRKRSMTEPICSKITKQIKRGSKLRSKPQKKEFSNQPSCNNNAQMFKLASLVTDGEENNINGEDMGMEMQNISAEDQVLLRTNDRFEADGIEVTVEGAEAVVSDDEEDTVDSEINFRLPRRENRRSIEKLKNPSMKKMIDELLIERLNELSPQEVLQLQQQYRSNGNEEVDVTTVATPRRAGNHGNGNKESQKTVTNTTSNKDPLLKSPSDTTLYKPAFARKDKRRKDDDPFDKLVNNNESIINKVSNFVEAIRISEQDRREAGTSGSQMRSTATIPGYEDAKNRTDNAVIEAEKFCAAIEHPQGNFNSQFEIPNVGDLRHLGQVASFHDNINDDDFFHMTCHVDANLRKKIENGEYVDLEKLVPKDRGSPFAQENNRLEWVQRDGNTFLAPVTGNNKITNVKKWDQAFRMYATFYCGANPSRSREIWQYVDIIHTAANTFVWDNVYNYDVTFRHLMEFNPQRSWGKTYTQMWHLAMKEPLFKNGFNRNQNYRQNNGYFSNGASTKNNQQNQSHQGAAKKKPDYCWNYNRGIRCKYGNKCKYIERCSYCDASNHAKFNCPKIERSAKSPAKSD